MGELRYPYKYENFLIKDWDFENALWRYWVAESADGGSFWVNLLRVLIADGEMWGRALSATVYQKSTSNSVQRITQENLTPRWILKMRQYPCLPDTDNVPRIPNELVRRTAHSEPYMGVELFVHRDFDTEAVHRLLDALGVRSKPVDPVRLVDILRSLSDSGAPVVQIDDWYRRLDKMAADCGTDELSTLKRRFATEKPVLTEGGTWERASDVFIECSGSDVPDVPLVRGAIKELTLWHRIGVGDRPTVELAIAWLNSVTRRVELVSDVAKRVRALLKRDPQRLWYECGCWISLDDEWLPTDEFSQFASGDTKYGNLFPRIRRQTADFTFLDTPPDSFMRIPSLAERVVSRVRESPGACRHRNTSDWVSEVGRQLASVILEDDTETTRVRGLGIQLGRTELLELDTKIEIDPYMDGAPAGTTCIRDVVWDGTSVLMAPLSHGKRAKLIPEEIGKRFQRGDVKDLIAFSYERPIDSIRDYVGENFDTEAQTGEAVGAGVPDDLDSGRSGEGPDHGYEQLFPRAYSDGHKSANPGDNQEFNGRKLGEHRRPDVEKRAIESADGAEGTAREPAPSCST